jgi:AbrB family looped-hinge helix DNA binding protein
MANEVKLSSKGQIVLPKDAREKLRLKRGDKLKVEIDERTKSIIMHPSVSPPEEVFVRAGTKLTRSVLNEADEIDERKIKKLLNAIGIKKSP